MGRFANASKQAAAAVKPMQGSDIKGLGTIRNFESSLKLVAEYTKEEKLGSLQDLTIEDATRYLELRALDVGNKTLDQDRHAIQAMFHFVTNKLALNERLPIVRSEDSNKQLTSRTYTIEQVKKISSHQDKGNSLATLLAESAGLRAHEILTINYPTEQPITPRFSNEPALSKFCGRDGVIYTVTGKGGLTREVMFSHELSQKLEMQRLEQPRNVVDREISYKQHYDISGGQKWSNSFSAASNRALGWSRGAHGLRHSYAQQRVLELQKQGLSPSEAKRTVSQELGHFRTSIIEVYLR